jgi:hypothetical protein
MGETLRFVADHRSGIWVLLVTLVVLCVVLQWCCWIFRLGRFRVDAVMGTRQPNPLRFVVAEFFVRLINDFRHLLALIVVFMFALALFTAMMPGMLDRDLNSMKDGLQAVAAALAGLIGSIIGYYFGESAGRKELERAVAVESSSPLVQGEPAAGGDGGEIRPAPKPPRAGTE